MIEIRKALPEEYERVKGFYDSLIDALAGAKYSAGWTKDIYPDQTFLRTSIDKGEWYLLLEDAQIAGAMVLNNEHNESYDEYEWPVPYKDEEVMMIHALGVHSLFTGRGYAKKMVEYAIDKAKAEGFRTIRLDVLKGNRPAEHLYPAMGFVYRHTLPMYYPDTGWTEYALYEYELTEGV